MPECSCTLSISRLLVQLVEAKYQIVKGFGLIIVLGCGQPELRAQQCCHQAYGGQADLDHPGARYRHHPAKLEYGWGEGAERRHYRGDVVCLFTPTVCLSPMQL
jgi:hypothetical protein